MCGRFSLTIDLEFLLEWFSFSVGGLEYWPRYNIAPTQSVLTYGARGAHTAEYMRWGLIPSWKIPDQKLPLMINARDDTLPFNGVFKQLLQRRRCLILADSFYEWRRNGKEKTPLRIGLKGWEPFGFAGLWDTWHDPEKGEVQSCTIITCSPNEFMKPIHNRMPLILPPEAYGPWLDNDKHNLDELMSLLRPDPSNAMEACRVSYQLNSVKNDSPDVIACID